MRTESNMKSNQAPAKQVGVRKQPVAKDANSVKHDAIVLLKQDHAEVKKMFKQFDKLAEKEDIEGKTEMANKICAELIAHTLAEEEIFYPATKEAIEDDDLLNEAKVEHDSAKALIKQILGMNAEDPMYDAKVTVLGEYITHHVEEEETEMFPMVRESKKIDLKKMGAMIAARKEELMEELCAMGGAIDPQQLQAKLGMNAKH